MNDVPLRARVLLSPHPGGAESFWRGEIGVAVECRENATMTR
jgi:hypothetical protein